MNTRKDYLGNKCSHHQYHVQFVTPSLQSAVKERIGLERILNSGDPHLNDIPLVEWDQFLPLIRAQFEVTTRMKEAGDFLTLAGAVCIAKAAARQIINNESHEHTTADTTGV